MLGFRHLVVMMRTGGNLFLLLLGGFTLSRQRSAALYLLHLFAIQLPDPLLLDLDSNHVSTSVGISSDEEWVCVRSSGLACGLDSNEPVNVDCSRKEK